ncbi:MAG: hypothetical protein RIA64_08930 [Rhodospirillales bacterium]
MNKKQKFAAVVELTEFEEDVLTDYIEARWDSIEDYLADMAHEQVRDVVYQHTWDDEILTEEELREFNNDYFDDREADFLRDEHRYD